MPSNDLLERFYMGDRMTETKGQGKVEQTSYMNVHKSHPGSPLSIFDMGLCAQARPHTERPN